MHSLEIVVRKQKTVHLSTRHHRPRVHLETQRPTLGPPENPSGQTKRRAWVLRWDTNTNHSQGGQTNTEQRHPPQTWKQAAEQGGSQISGARRIEPTGTVNFLHGQFEHKKSDAQGGAVILIAVQRGTDARTPMRTTTIQSIWISAHR
jgi:hypothetical protein